FFGLCCRRYRNLRYQRRFTENSRKRMLRDWDAVWASLPEVDAQFIRDTRKKLKCSRALFARRLCMNERTLEKWEQARAKPNAQAVVLLLLVRYFPDTLERVRRIATRDLQTHPGRLIEQFRCRRRSLEELTGVWNLDELTKV